MTSPPGFHAGMPSLQLYADKVQDVCPSCLLNGCSLEAFGILCLVRLILATCGPEAFATEPSIIYCHV